jgi:hypothetical protein
MSGLYSYRVTVAGEYDLMKRDDTIAAVRAWAKCAFPKKHVTVTRADAYRFCDLCQSAPCCCSKRTERFVGFEQPTHSTLVVSSAVPRVPHPPLAASGSALGEW